MIFSATGAAAYHRSEKCACTRRKQHGASEQSPVAPDYYGHRSQHSHTSSSTAFIVQSPSLKFGRDQLAKPQLRRVFSFFGDARPFSRRKAAVRTVLGREQDRAHAQSSSRPIPGYTPPGRSTPRRAIPKAMRKCQPQAPPKPPCGQLVVDQPPGLIAINHRCVIQPREPFAP